MNVVIWVLAGGFAGWVAFKFIGANEYRGMIMSMVIGICGGYFGGSVLAPLLSDSVPVHDAISPIALVMALASAAVCLTIGDMISRRFNV
jgi:uncharacterized membrane protein YeaQ/YmgE (transglycosylase-associated protein family)